MTRVQQLTIFFENELAPYEVPAFRGAVNAALEEGHNVLYHNHIDGGLRFSYPLIQYKRIKGKAAMVCLNEGTEAIGEFFNLNAPLVKIGEQDMELKVRDIRAEKTLVTVWQTEFEYRIGSWLALNSQNYKEYLAAGSLVERIGLLEKVLTGNVLSFCKGIGVHVEQQISCKITSLREPRCITYKGVKMMAFDAEFVSNVSLPNWIGLGKDASVGYGVITRKINKS